MWGHFSALFRGGGDKCAGTLLCVILLFVNDKEVYQKIYLLYSNACQYVLNFYTKFYKCNHFAKMCIFLY